FNAIAAVARGIRTTDHVAGDGGVELAQVGRGGVFRGVNAVVTIGGDRVSGDGRRDLTVELDEEPDAIAGIVSVGSVVPVDDVVGDGVGIEGVVRTGFDVDAVAVGVDRVTGNCDVGDGAGVVAV